MSEIITTGIVLSSMPIGEYDRRVELLTQDLGRISAFARGARKPGSSLISLTRVFAFGKFTLAQGRSAYNIKGASISNYFEELSDDMDRLSYGFYFLEVSRYFTRENMECLDMLKLLYYSLRALSAEKTGKRLVRCIFELKTLILNGVCPAHDRLFADTGSYAFAQGTASGAKKAFDYVWSSAPEKLFTFVLNDKALEDFETIVNRLFEMNTDRKFKSLSLVDSDYSNSPELHNS